MDMHSTLCEVFSQVVSPIYIAVSLLPVRRRWWSTSWKCRP